MPSFLKGNPNAGTILCGLSVFILIAGYSCKHRQTTLFTRMDAGITKITFENKVTYSEEFNTYTYRNFYNGAGVGLGDFNRDGLPDIYFCGNMAGNRLYLNKDNFKFEDITEKAGVSCAGSWNTGVSIADVNGDGWPDIYICKSGRPEGNHRNNELFINNGDLTFTEESAKFGLDVTGLSNHASFFDYDRDGDLDCYLLSNSMQSVMQFTIESRQREIRDSLGGNKLFRNDDGHFTDVSAEAGIYGSKIGFGLGASISDVNRDGWPDIYISNDFFERDYLYLNNQDGTFTECLENALQETSQGAMGADIADINNDGYPDIFTTEMTPEGNERRKTKAVFDSWDTYQQKLKEGYFRQFARNVLQLNNGNGTFSEIGRLSGVSTTDWSWGALVVDLDNDGLKDIYVANGIFKDLLDRDYLDFYSNPMLMRSMIKTEKKAILKIIDMIPSVKIPNYAFHNNGDLTFTNLSDDWGLALPSFSNGAAFGDLDNDGDPDLVVNNVNMPPFVYRNESSNILQNNYLTLILRGKGKNTGAIGTEITVYAGGQKSYLEAFPIRGFESTVDSRLLAGLGKAQKADSLVVIWPDGNTLKKFDVSANQALTLDQNEFPGHPAPAEVPEGISLFRQLESVPGFNFVHREFDYRPFRQNSLLFEAYSNEGPHMAVADVNNDGLEDVFICGAKDSPGAMYIQEGMGHFRPANEQVWQADRISEDTDCAFFDADGDGDMDLYVASGSNEFPSISSALADRLYLNDAKGNFRKDTRQVFPAGKYESTSCVVPADYDLDGDMDLFVGIRLQPSSYGLPCNGYLLENNGKGEFRNVTPDKAGGLLKLGMITDMVWADVDNDKDPDMVIVGDWMTVKVFINDHGKFADASGKYGLSGTSGWWHTLVAQDLNKDGNIDFILGNHGLNSFFKAGTTKPLTMFVNDFDLDGTIEQVICTKKGDKMYPFVLRDDLLKQIPSLAARYKKYADYANQSLDDLFSPDVVERSIKLEALQMRSIVLINSGKGSFEIKLLPEQAQFSPVYAIFAGDIDKDGNCDILMGGNQYTAKPENGIYAGGYGIFLKNTGENTWQAVSALRSGFSVKGEIRDFKILNINKKQVLVIAKNNEPVEFYNIKNP